MGGWQINRERKAARRSGLTSAGEEAKLTKEQIERERFNSQMKGAGEAHRLENGAGVK